MFPISLTPGESYVCMIQVRADQSAINVPLLIASANKLSNIHNTEALFFGACFGILILIFFLGLIMTFFIMQPTYLYYSLYILFAIIFFLAQTGYLYQYLIPDWTVINNYASTSSTLISLIVLSLFASHIMKLKERKHWWNIVHDSTIWIATACLLLQFIDYYLANMILIYFAVLCFPVFITSGILAWHGGSQIAPYLILGWFLYLFGGIVFGLRNFGLLPNSFVINNSLLLAALAEIGIFTFAIGHKYRDALYQIGIAQEAQKRKGLEAENERMLRHELQLKKEVADRELLIQNMKFSNQTEMVRSLNDAPDEITLKRELNKMIRSNSSAVNWDTFSELFERVHPDFFKKAMNGASNLTGKDLRLMAYMKMNLDTKEIARLMNVKHTTIQVGRHRLKQKLGLEESLSLATYIHNI